MNVQNVIDIALTAGEILLENGAENYRIEDTVSKICKSYGFNSECIAMSNGLLLLVEDCNLEKITSMKKIKEKHVDLYRIELINSFSRKLEKSLLTYEDAKKSLEKIKNAPNFTLSVRTMAACMTGFIYTLFFNGSILDGLIAIIVCLITYIVFEKISKLGFFQFLESFLAGLLIGGLSMFSHTLLSSVNSHNVIAGSIMILIPGVILTNGIKDIIYGDFSAGCSKFFEALLIIVAVGVGIGTSLFIGINTL